MCLYLDLYLYLDCTCSYRLSVFSMPVFLLPALFLHSDWVMVVFVCRYTTCVVHCFLWRYTEQVHALGFEFVWYM